MIYLKLLLLVVLSVLPYIYAWYIKPKRNTSSIWRNFFLVMGHIPGVRFLYDFIKRTVRRIFRMMRYSDNARKFFSRVVLLFLLFVQFTDLMASRSSVMLLHDARQVSSWSTETVVVLNAMVTPVMVMILSNLLAGSLFFYKWSDKMLTSLHDKRRFFFCFVFCMVCMMISFRTALLVETLVVLMAASCLYPEKEDEQTNGGLRISERKERKNLMAA